MLLFHLISRSDWERAERAGVYAPPSLSAEGFIHLSTETQWPRTAQRFYAGRPALLLLTVDPARAGAEVRYEPADGEHFPHLYGPLPLGAVLEVREVHWSSGGDPSARGRVSSPP